MLISSQSNAVLIFVRIFFSAMHSPVSCYPIFVVVISIPNDCFLELTKSLGLKEQHMGQYRYGLIKGVDNDLCRHDYL